ncbi:MAG: FAD-dependent oxidoreductase [Candidatus Devosia phytovorans]|uniref:FAD-dependent oxidoreductase n=1 Tax=Candidatus Devosia phytovorans TaxID=3121372 RepID=A0AAJ6B1J2_9HYPH|nr:FAD-dependent oxidoreductase [Devosia sp.]WEK06322.1 MAG: FAD-dependent oxidoreductase [Devosia sp.]
MKPVGLTNPRNPTVKAYAIVQLRQDNALGTLWNMVGFQTKMRYGIQADIFRMIPGLRTPVRPARRAASQHLPQFAEVLRPDLKLKADPRLRFAGQVTGRRGLCRERRLRAASPAVMAAAEARARNLPMPPARRRWAPWLHHITGGHMEAEGYSGARSFQPMNVNFGLFPEVTITKPEGAGRWRGTEKTQAKRRAITSRALTDLEAWG